MLEHREKNVALKHEHASDCALQADNLKKSYGATVALEYGSIKLEKGKVHALLGENGAGKSTLVKILSGAVIPDVGDMTLESNNYNPNSIRNARNLGVATAFQELSLVSNLTVAENLLLPKQIKGRFGLNSRSAGEDQAAEVLRRYNMSRIHPRRLVGELPLAERQRLEILRAMEDAEKVLILDEPTASLAETDWLFDLIRKKQTSGVGILYISHRLPEVRELAHRATVLRNGRSVAEVELSRSSDDDIFEMMVGHKVTHERTSRSNKHSGKVRLKCSQLQCKGVRGISLELTEGEILGVAALEGQGQRGLFRCLAGVDKLDAGEISLDGVSLSLKNPRHAVNSQSGIAFLPEERKTEGILAGMTTASNIVLPIMSNISKSGLVRPKDELSCAQSVAKMIDLSPRYLGFSIGDLSGGNQQKALIARTMATGAKTLLLYDPTRGVDVGTKQSIYRAIKKFAEQGGSVLFYSSELPEIVQLADRAIVLYGGNIQAEYRGDDMTEQRLVAAMVGHRETPSVSVTYEREMEE